MAGADQQAPRQHAYRVSKAPAYNVVVDSRAGRDESRHALPTHHPQPWPAPGQTGFLPHPACRSWHTANPAGPVHAQTELAAPPFPAREEYDSAQQTAAPGNSRRESGHRPGRPPDADDQDASHAPPRRPADTAGMPERKFRCAQDALLPAFEAEYRLLRSRIIFHLQLDIMTPVLLVEIQRHPAAVIASVRPLAGDKGGKLVRTILDIGGMYFLHRTILQRIDFLVGLEMAFDRFTIQGKCDRVRYKKLPDIKRYKDRQLRIGRKKEFFFHQQKALVDLQDILAKCRHVLVKITGMHWRHCQ